MDTVTQAMLGAVVARAVLPTGGARVLVWGAAAGVLPDLDMLATPFQDDVDRFTSHRSLTHSLLIMLPAVVPLSKLCARFSGHTRREWLWLLFWCFLTHILLDLCTTYGTQIFWPLSRYPYALSIVFIIDPAYSLILIGALALLCRRAAPPRAACYALALSTAYLLVAAGLKLHAHHVLKETLDERGAPYANFTVQNTPFNVVLWQAIATGPGGDTIAWYHVLKKETEVRHTPAHPLAEAVLDQAAAHPRAARLLAFTKGLHRIEERAGGLYLIDLRFGAGRLRPFVFHLAHLRDGAPLLLPVPRRSAYGAPEDTRAAWRELYRRLF